MLSLRSCSEPHHKKSDPDDKMGLSTLPYDLLLNVATYLDLRDVHALHLTCRALHDFSTTRPVYRKLANDLLRRCRALPLKGFQRLSDLTTEQLIRSVNKATRYELAWRTRAPHPITAEPYCGINSHSNYMDLAGSSSKRNYKWYKVVSAPPGEEVDWLSPITSSYTLCATKSGKVVCWDVQSDRCLAEWNPGERWELWKCRVEFEERTVFFTMAKVLSGSYDDDRVMEFVLMRLTFFDGPSGESSKEAPVFSHVTDFRTTGVVMNVFLLDPSERLLSAFVWVSGSNTIGLYALPDWDRLEYVFIDTGIDCAMSSNWSCILYDQNIVIHCEESDAAFQHFYPLSLLQAYAKILVNKQATPFISARVPPAKTITKKFIFPLLSDTEPESPSDLTFFDAPPPLTDGIPIHNGSIAIVSANPAAVVPTGAAANHNHNPNPFPFPPWYPESAHFVRQWWPSLPNIPRVSCTVVLLAAHDQITHRTRFVLAQHYFRVPLNHCDWVRSSSARGMPSDSARRLAKGNTGPSSRLVPVNVDEAEAARDDALMHLWYVSTPFEVVRVLDVPEEEDEAGTQERPRPLVAVDFGHAVWIEHVDTEEDQLRFGASGIVDNDAKWLRFVTFPPFSEDYDADRARKPGLMQGEVRTLEVPDELDLGTVETINIDQSQGAVILSDKDGRIFILCYE